jgi:hypothetical protein
VNALVNAGESNQMQSNAMHEAAGGGGRRAALEIRKGWGIIFVGSSAHRAISHGF